MMVAPRLEHLKRFYTWLLRLYPQEHTAEYSEEMIRLFTDQYREAMDKGNPIGVKCCALYPHC